MDIYNLPSINNDNFYEIILGLKRQDLINLCLTNKALNEKLCNNEDFWRTKFIKEYGNIQFNSNYSWKQLYWNYNSNYNKLYIFNDYDYTPSKYLNIQFKDISYNFARNAVYLIDTEDNVYSRKDDPGIDFKLTNIKASLINFDYENYNPILYYISSENLSYNIYNIKKSKEENKIFNGPILNAVEFFGYHMITDRNSNLWTNAKFPNFLGDQGDFINTNIKVKYMIGDEFMFYYIDINDEIYYINNFQQSLIPSTKGKIMKLIDGKYKAVYHIDKDTIALISLNNDIYVRGNNNDNRFVFGDENLLEFTLIPDIKGKYIYNAEDKIFIIDINDNILVSSYRTNNKFIMLENFKGSKVYATNNYIYILGIKL